MEQRRKAILVFVFFTLFYALSNSFRPTVQMPDEEYVLLVTSNLVSQRPLYLPDAVPKYPGAADLGKNGKYYSAYQIGQSLVYAPFYFATKQILSWSEPYGSVKYGSEVEYDVWLERETRRYLYLCPTLFAALSCAIFFLFACGLGFAETTGLALTVFYGLGTMVWPYSKLLLTETTQNLLLLSAVYLLFNQRKEGALRPKAMALAGACFGLLLSIRVIFIVLLPVLAVYWFWKNRSERRLIAPILAFGLPAALLFVPQLIYDYVRFSNVFSLGYGGAGFTTPLYVGLFGFLFSPGKSFFLYSPVALLFFFGMRPFLKRARAEALLFCAIGLIVPIKYAGWWVWSGDPCWGPRFLLVITPFLLLPAGEILERVIQRESILKRAIVALLFALSFTVQVLAVSVHYLYFLNYVRQAASFVPPSRLVASPLTADGALPLRDRHLDTEFNPEYSPILGQAWLVKTLLTHDPHPALSAPWKGLGFTALHDAVPLKVAWDIWVVELLREGLYWRNIKAILGAIALLMILTIVGQELFRSVFVPRP
ncbi:MAG TPA: hypothetical protein VI895_11710 [Bdellovibrionota bacterium]|nr:hypothetical protein [Bdellovibrionota bacterium]